MRTLRSLCATLLLCGCATWRASRPADVRTDRGDTKRILALTKADRALEIEVLRADDQRLYGKVLRAWRVPLARRGDNLEGSESPDDTAERRGWQPEPALGGGQQIDLALSEISAMRVYEPRTGQTVAATIGGVLGGLLIITLVAGAIVLSQINYSCGRPLRVRGRSVITKASACAGPSAWSQPLAIAPVPEDVRKVLAEVWALEARSEHAAIAAFSKASLELLALGAPPELVAGANRAAIQEVEHARLCFAVASAYSGKTLAPAPLPEALAGDTPDLSRLARESLLDGCLREGLAAEVARLGAERARDPEVARVLRVQAKEEQLHAALSWRIVEWALESGGEPMRRSLLAAMGKLEFPRCDDLPDHGRVGRALVEPYFHEIRARARERLASIGLRAAA